MRSIFYLFPLSSSSQKNEFSKSVGGAPRLRRHGDSQTIVFLPPKLRPAIFKLYLEASQFIRIRQINQYGPINQLIGLKQDNFLTYTLHDHLVYFDPVKRYGKTVKFERFGPDSEILLAAV